MDIGGIIEGTYVHTPAASHARNGMYQICTDEVMMNSGNHYDAYKLENGAFIRLEEHLFSRDYSLQGTTIHLEFRWAEHNGYVCITEIDPEAPVRIYNMSGDPSKVLAELFIPHSYPVLLNLRTGQLQDVLAGTGAETVQNIGNAALTPDGSKMLLVTGDEKIYLADLLEKKLYDLEALSGEPVEECVVTGNTVTCMVLEGDSIEEAQLGRCRAWSIDLDTRERKEILSIAATPASSPEVWSEHQGEFRYDEEGNFLSVDSQQQWNEAGIQFLDGFNRTIHWGNMYAGSRFAVEVDAQRNVWVIDLSSGEKGLIPGFLWPEIPYPILECQPSPDGNKLLLYTRAQAGRYDRVGVLDFEKRLYFEFDRENTRHVRERLIYWFDHNSIMIAADGEGQTRDYYLHQLSES